MSTEPLPGVPGRPAPGVPSDPHPKREGVRRSAGSAEPSSDAAFDPLKLCIFTTVALLAWVFGPAAVLAFSCLGLAGYWRAHRAGLTRSRCYLRDVRLVLAYLALIATASTAFLVHDVMAWIGN